MEEMARPGILVGYDGSAHSARALDWAVLEARRHAMQLVICTAVPQGAADPLVYGTGWIPDSTHVAAAEDLLDQAKNRIAATAPDVSVATDTVRDAPSRGLVEQAKRAEMAVVGSRGLGGVAGLLLGSVSTYVVNHASCPVVVVPTPDETMPERERGLVVVGYDRSAASEAALDFAFAEAALRGAELEIVHSWHDPYLAGYVVPDREVAEHRQRQARDLVLHAIEPWAAKQPHLVVSPAFTHEPPAGFLVKRSASADLVVVGWHGHGAFARMLLGAVSNAVVHGARCPVAVIR